VSVQERKENGEFKGGGLSRREVKAESDGTRGWAKVNDKKRQR
jgi:hypothetical protein